ncbi:MAG: hypothetical protein H7641_06125 [Candidatus Heimdallarchaeota archaeon]|nr:hypothetical protein [Candidatus Heimdallarchaeota archaeon]MCK4877138.1 hypothetical protein [Candidatus Heimdallarchaeota archaeon]
MYQERKKITFPNGLYEYLVRMANTAVGENFIGISFPILEIKFLNLRRKGSPKTVGWLFEELSKRLVNISNKYDLEIGQSSHRKDVMINYRVEDNYRQINITGYHHIPLKSFGNILAIALWSYIVFILAKKPSEDEEARNLYKKFTDDLDEFREHWNRSSRKKITLGEKRSCYICGKKAYSYNQWFYKQKRGVEEVLTPVCKTHSNLLV